MILKKNIFKDIVVLELASVLAGPYAGRFFLELGARVLKIENPLNEGDITRKWKTPEEERKGQEPGSYYLSVNEGKEILFLNLKSREGKEKFFHLLEKTDVLLTNLPYGKNLGEGIEKEHVLKKYPQLVWINVCGYSCEPSRQAFDLIIQAEAGYMYMNREKEGQPAKIPVALMDVLAGHQITQAALTGLWYREKTGKGAYEEVYLMESAMAAWVNQAALYTVSGITPEPSGSLHPNISPYGEIFTCKDGKQIVLAVGTQQQFTELCHLLELTDIPHYPMFANNTRRVQHRTKLFQILSERISSFTSIELLNRCKSKKVPAGIINTIPEAISVMDKNLLLSGNKRTISNVAFRFFAQDDEKNF